MLASSKSRNPELSEFIGQEHPVVSGLAEIEPPRNILYIFHNNSLPNSIKPITPFVRVLKGIGQKLLQHGHHLTKADPLPLDFSY
jgi:hypothetical protein